MPMRGRRTCSQHRATGYPVSTGRRSLRVDFLLFGYSNEFKPLGLGTKSNYPPWAERSGGRKILPCRTLVWLPLGAHFSGGKPKF